MTQAFSFAVAQDFGTALLLGALLGLEREKRNVREGFGVAGLRSFVMLATLGATGGYLGVQLQQAWMLPATILAATGLVVAGYFAGLRVRPEQVGLTTELAALVTCLVGALATTGHREIAIGLGVVTATLLAYKQPLHAMVGRIGWDDVLVGLRLLLATFIVLPLLPDRAIDPWGAINLQKLWLLVLLISGLSLVGYIASRWLGPGRGIAVTATAGALASSTAVTLALTRQSRQEGAVPSQLAGGILLAWGVMFGRVLVAAAVVCPAMLPKLLPAFVAMASTSLLVGVLFLRAGRHAVVAEGVPIKNPFSLVAAGKFAALFALVQLLLKLGQEHLPQSGIHAVAALAGLTDVDAITLSMAERARLVAADTDLAVTAIVVACASNTLVKAGIAIGSGRGLGRLVALGTGLVCLAGFAALLVARVA
ncbi:MAG: MgtC/SapB family protein [Planctomycetes bacterium]|nr:MgtC/SapB family protein [Planctomycetota bacterium]